MNDDDITAVGNALQAYDSTVVNKSWRDLAIVAISALAARDFATQQAVQVQPDPQAIVEAIFKNCPPTTYGDANYRDTICAMLMGNDKYEAWLESQN